MSGAIVITGGCGFLGAALARKIAQHGVTLPDGRRLSNPQLHLWDVAGTPPPELETATFVSIDIADVEAVERQMPADVALVYHLAAVVSGQAEADYDLGMRVNLGGTNAVLAAAKARGPQTCVVGTSSLAVYGHNAVEPLTEATPIQPRNTYGVTKAMAELVMADYRRRSWCDARTLRLPTVTVRPGKPNAAASSFVSSIMREPLAGEAAICPVDPALKMWIASPQAAVDALHHAPSVSAADWPAFGAVNVPGLQVSVGKMLEALRVRMGDAVADRVTMAAICASGAIVETWPSRFDTSVAKALGFQGDDSFNAILDQALRIR
ncbi:MAG: D-erythronate dehydrogenase [Pseudomonadota bacterium]